MKYVGKYSISLVQLYGDSQEGEKKKKNNLHQLWTEQ